MNKKGFTLIELLAVIVILAIIALIAVPMILNIIDDTKNSANKRSKELYLKAVEQAIARKNLTESFNPEECIIQENGNLDCEGTILNIETEGSRPISGTITIKDGKVSSKDIKFSNSSSNNNKDDNNTEVGKDNTNAEIPTLSRELTPVKYNGENWVVADITKQWYNYENQEWANAVLLKSEVKKSVGNIVDVNSEVQAMFVWVPRYEYKIEGEYGKGGTSASSPGEIEINFISKEIVYENTNSEGYRIHPAFWWDNNSNGIEELGEQLSGIWVGKFETTGTADNPTILPSVSSLRYQNVSKMFETAQKFNAYLTSMDSYMMKNSEWGAVAYISQSKYGKYGNPNYIGEEKQVRINNCSSYITGIGADSQNAVKSTETCTTNTYDAKKGQTASTTGNITGVYDMSGGAREYVMGVYNETINKSGFSTLPESKYYDNYTTDSSTTACNGGVCYGHALNETSEWYDDYAGFVSSSGPWFERGGDCSQKSAAGLFYFHGYIGTGSTYNSFRIVISPTT